MLTTVISTDACDWWNDYVIHVTSTSRVRFTNERTFLLPDTTEVHKSPLGDIINIIKTISMENKFHFEHMY